MIKVVGSQIIARTKTVTAVFERGFLILLKNNANGEEFISAPTSEGSALQLLYPGSDAIDVVGKVMNEVEVISLSDSQAQFCFNGWDGDGIISISEDIETGDVLVEPSAYASVPNLLACRWLLKGIRSDFEIVAPFFQGVKMKMDDPLLKGRWPWPMFWEAGLLIFQGDQSGFWVHVEDDQYRYKAVDISNDAIAFETEAYGPVNDSLGAGGLVWRLNAFAGDWQVPAERYRQWLWKAYNLDKQEALRKPWIHECKFALSWYGGNPEILDAIATKVDPKKVIIHYSNWRTDEYDENYPDYIPSDQAINNFKKANEMGFHLMPHCNSVDMDPSNPAYQFVRDFQYRDIQSRHLHGWAWDNTFGGILGVPNSYNALTSNRPRKVMIKAHPGLAMWRSILARNILGAVEQLDTDTVFIDVTLCSGNLHNCLVENTTSSEGMNRLIRQIAALKDGLAVGGEGLNEITMQGLSFAQAHLFRSWHASDNGLERTGGCALNDFLFGRLCKTIGYSGLSGKNENEELRMKIHLEHNALPTVVVGNPQEILQPNKAVAEMIDRANAN